MKTSLQNIRDIFMNPKASFVRLKDEPKWLLAFGLCCLGFILVEWITDPFEIHILSDSVTKESTITDTLHISRSIIGFLGSIVVGGFMILVLLIVDSTLCLGVVRLFRINRTVLKFSHIYSCLTHLLLIYVGCDIVNTLLLLIFKSPQDIHARLDMQMIPGLHHALSFLENQKLLTVLSEVNLLSVWEVVLLSIAVGIMIGVGRSRSILIAICFWFVTTVFAAIFYYAISS